MNNIIELDVTLSPEEAMSRIIASSDEERFAFSLSGHAGDKPFLLRRDGNSFRVQKRRFYRNSFHPYLFARVEPTAYGSRITGHFSISGGTKTFMMLWFLGVGLFGGMMIIKLVSDYLNGKISGNEALWAFHPIGMLVFGFLLIVIGKLLSRNEVRDISVWLRGQFADVALESSWEKEA
jgi:hypothetical protein